MKSVIHALKIKYFQLGIISFLISIFIFPFKYILKALRDYLINNRFIRDQIIYKLPRYKIYSIFDGLDENSIVIDLGASVGNVSKYIFDKFNCRIECYEPNIVCFNILNKRFSKNHKINTYNSAVSNSAGKEKLYLSSLNIEKKNLLIFSQSSTLDKEKSNINNDNYILVNVVDINSILKKFKYIDLIKIDIEGSEYNILDILVENRHKIGKIVCELHDKSPNQSISKNKIIQKLNNKGLLNSWFFNWY